MLRYLIAFLFIYNLIKELDCQGIVSDLKVYLDNPADSNAKIKIYMVVANWSKPANTSCIDDEECISGICLKTGFCSEIVKTADLLKANGEYCIDNGECETNNCLSTNVCAPIRIYFSRAQRYAKNLITVTVKVYKGCYIDTADRDLPQWVTIGMIGMTIDSCITGCAALNKRYIGVQNAYACFCGDTYGKHGPGLESSCTMNCAGDNTQICGGFGRNSVYEIVPVKTVDYKGCYIDTADRDLSLFSGIVNSVDSCFEHCDSQNKRYFAVQNSNECFCGDSYGNHGQASETDCYACSGDLSQKCGAAWRNSVYEIIISRL